jgi:hypothetical protein
MFGLSDLGKVPLVSALVALFSQEERKRRIERIEVFRVWLN